MTTPAPGPLLTSALMDIGLERRRQVDVEGWTAEHDDQHASGDLARAAACYAQPADRRDHLPVPHHHEHNGRAQAGDAEWSPAGGYVHAPRDWPWEGRWWKPDHQDRRRDLVRAGALIVAEIERMDRAAMSGPTMGPQAFHKLDNDRQVFFYEQDFYVLSNFSSFEVEWTSNYRFKTAEHCYHWLRFATGAANGKLGGAEVSAAAKALADRVRRAPSAHEAFRMAQAGKHLQRSDWNDVKVDKMRLVIRAKAAQHEYVRRKLLATGDRELIEDSWRDDFWGWGPNRDGQNMLGRLWTELRSEMSAGGVKS